MRDLGAAISEANKQAQGSPWVWLVYLETTNPTTGGKEAFRYTTNNRIVEFGFDETNGVVQWKPAPIAIGKITEDGEGSLPRISVSIANIRDDIVGTLWERDWLEGERAELILVNLATIGEPDSAVRFEATVEDVAATEQRVTFRLSGQDLYQVTVPRLTIARTGCRHQYGGEVCQFPVDTLDPGKTLLGECVKTLEACRLRKERAEDQSYTPVLWPRRYGAFPGANS